MVALKLLIRLTLCLFASFLTYTVLVRTVAEGILWETPIRIAEWIVHVVYPDMVIDGETAYDVRMSDSFIFYGGIIFLCYLYLSYKVSKWQEICGDTRGS